MTAQSVLDKEIEVPKKCIMNIKIHQILKLYDSKDATAMLISFEGTKYIVNLCDLGFNQGDSHLLDCYPTQFMYLGKDAQVHTNTHNFEYIEVDDLASIPFLPDSKALIMLIRAMVSEREFEVTKHMGDVLLMLLDE